MKYFFLFALYSLPSLAFYSKPELLARYSGIDSFNAADNLYCFTSEPLPTQNGIYLGCQDSKGYLMAHFAPSFTVLARSETRLFSSPQEVNKKVSWYEFDESGVKNFFQDSASGVQSTELRDLSSSLFSTDAFTPVTQGQFVYRAQEDSIRLYLWRENSLPEMLYLEDAAHIFPPVTSSQGHFLLKVRKDHTGENAPDELLLWDGAFSSLLKDKDADPRSPWKSFRHQLAMDQGVVAFIGVDDEGEGLFLLENGVTTPVVRVGKDLQALDFFTPKLKNGVLVFRGVDLEKRKTIWVYREGRVQRLLTQGDTIKTDKGLARVDYFNRDAIFYGSAGIGPQGEIILQATLVDAQYTATLLGIGLLRFNP